MHCLKNHTKMILPCSSRQICVIIVNRHVSFLWIFQALQHREKKCSCSGIGISLDHGQKFPNFYTNSHSLLANFLVHLAPTGSFSCYKIFLPELTVMVCNKHSYKVIKASICAIAGLLFHRTQMHNDH